MTVRKMRASDILQVEKICIDTATSDFCRENPEQTLINYNRYYTRQGVDDCFVTVDENDRAVGYILCASDFKTFAKGFAKHELRDASRFGVSAFFLALSQILSPLPFRKRFSAHMHIDILDDYQRCGRGHELVDALVSHLREKGVKGLMLAVAKDNIKGVSFYKKYGFEVIKDVAGSFVMGLEIK